MVESSLLFEIATMGLAWWLGLYLLGRDAANPSMRFAGLGLTAYSLAVVFNATWKVLQEVVKAEPSVINAVARLGWPLIFIPAFFWFGSLYFLLPNENSTRRSFDPIVRYGLIPLAIFFYIIAATSELFVIVEDGDTQSGLVIGPLFPFLAALLGIIWLAAFSILVRAYRVGTVKQPIAVLLVATLFFGLGLGLILFPIIGLPQRFMLLAVGFDLALLGLAIGFLDAFDQGETLLPDMSRSFIFSFLITLLFAGQIGLAMALSTGITLAMLFLLWATIVTAITITTFSDFVQSAIDVLAFAKLPRVRSTRDDSRLLVKAAARIKDTLDPALLDEEQFRKMTRKALSHLGDLPHLSASPLTRMPIITERLRERGAVDNSLERVAELKSVLVESIVLLKPRDKGDFGLTDEWRFFNALYYPYVIGLKPYSRRSEHRRLDSDSQEALDWFQKQVPERTLYNWQTAAAALIAQDIREQSSAD